MRPDLSRLTLCMMLLGLPGLVAAADLREDISTLVRNAASSVSSHALHYMKRGRHADLERLFPVLDSARFVEIAKDPHEELRDSYLFESPDAHHNRYKEGNVQIKAEDPVFDHVPEMFVGQPVRMLIMGSGGCGRLVALVARLVGKGVKSIHIVLVDPEYSHADSWLPLVESHNRYANACLDFTFFLKKLQEAYPGTQLSSECFSSVKKIYAQQGYLFGCKDCDEGFDVVYAIDYRGYDPYPRGYPRGLCGPDDRFTNAHYLAAIDLIKVAGDNLCKRYHCADPLFVVSKGKDILCLAPRTPGTPGTLRTLRTLRTPKSSLVNLRPLPQLVDMDLGRFDFFYLNANIDSLLLNLEHFAKTKKLLLINKNILDGPGGDAVDTLLWLQGVSFAPIRDAAALGLFESMPDKKCLVVDCTAMSPGEEPIPERYRRPNIFIVRMDDRSTDDDVRMRIYSPEDGHSARSGHPRD